MKNIQLTRMEKMVNMNVHRNVNQQMDALHGHSKSLMLVVGYILMIVVEEKQMG